MKNYTQEERIAMNKKILKWLSIPFVIFFILIFVSVIMDAGKPKKVEEVKVEKVLTSAEIKAEKIKKLFSAWDGSNNAVELYLKTNMNDPKSYEHIKTVYKERENDLLVITQFRGKNGFGSLVVQQISVIISYDGELLQVLSVE